MSQTPGQNANQSYFINHYRHNHTWAEKIPSNWSRMAPRSSFSPAVPLMMACHIPRMCGCYYHPEQRGRYREEKEKRQQVVQVVDLASGEVKREVRAREVWEVS